MQQRVVGQAAAQIERAIDHIRRGDVSTVKRELNKLRTGPAVWTVLSPADKAKLLRLLASLRLRADDVAAAERLADEVDCIALPSDEPRLRALIAWHRHGAGAVLRRPNPLDPDLIHKDETARALFDEAERAFARRLERSLDERDRAETETWQLAVLATGRHRRQETYAHTLLRHDLAHWGAIA